MNYRFKYICLLVVLFSISLNYASSQNEGRPVVTKKRTNVPNIRNISQANKINKEISGISNRLSSFMRIKANDIHNASWKRILIRRINLDDFHNEALKYTSENCRKNLFGIIFSLFLNNEINCYEYINAMELFDEKHIVDIRDIIEKFQISSRVESNKYIVEDADIPSNEVNSYYLKEVYYFDSTTSEFKREVISICPVITLLNDYGEEMKVPMFWVVYEDLKPFLSNVYVSISDMNMVEQYSLLDFIDMNMYKGDIVRVGNKSVNKLSSSTDSVEIVQKKIEQQLSDISLSTGSKLEHNVKEDKKINKKNSRDKRIYTESHQGSDSKSSSIVRSVRK